MRNGAIQSLTIVSFLGSQMRRKRFPALELRNKDILHTHTVAIYTTANSKLDKLLALSNVRKVGTCDLFSSVHFSYVALERVKWNTHLCIWLYSYANLQTSTVCIIHHY